MILFCVLSLQGFDEKFEVHKNLTEMRRQFDITKALANKKEKELKLLQEESDQLREKQQELKGSSVGVIEVLRIRKQILDSFVILLLLHLKKQQIISF